MRCVFFFLQYEGISLKNVVSASTVHTNFAIIMDIITSAENVMVCGGSAELTFAIHKIWDIFVIKVKGKRLNLLSSRVNPVTRQCHPTLIKDNPGSNPGIQLVCCLTSHQFPQSDAIILPHLSKIGTIFRDKAFPMRKSWKQWWNDSGSWARNFTRVKWKNCFHVTKNVSRGTAMMWENKDYRTLIFENFLVIFRCRGFVSGSAAVTSVSSFI